MFEAVFALKDDEGSLQEVTLSCNIAQGTIGIAQVGERDGDIPVIVAYRDRAVSCPMNQMSQWATRAKIPVYQYLFGSKWKGGNLTMPSGSLYGSEVELPASFATHGLDLTQVSTSAYLAHACQ